MNLGLTELSDLLPASLMFQTGHDGKYLTSTSSKADLSFYRLSLSFENHTSPKCQNAQFQAFSHNPVAF